MHRRENGKVTEVGSDVQHERTAAVSTHTAALQHLVEDLGGGGDSAERNESRKIWGEGDREPYAKSTTYPSGLGTTGSCASP